MKTPSGFTENEVRTVAAIAYLTYCRHGVVLGPEGLERYFWDGNSLERTESRERRWRKCFREIPLTSEFAAIAEAKGIPWDDARGQTAKMWYGLTIIAQPFDGRPLRKRLADAGITMAEYNAWMGNPAFAGKVREFSEQVLANSQHLSNEALVKGLEKGDLNAVRYYNEMTGRYNPAKEQAMDVAAVLARVIESIQRHVKDPVALAAIADDLNLAAGGQGVINGNVYTTPELTQTS